MKASDGQWQIQDNNLRAGREFQTFGNVAKPTLLAVGGWARSRGGRRRGGRRRGLQGGVDPAGVDPPVQGIGRLRIDAVAVQDQAAERRLNMAAGAAEPVVEI